MMKVKIPTINENGNLSTDKFFEGRIKMRHFDGLSAIENEEASTYFYPIYTTASSPNLPWAVTQWQYCAGFVISRNAYKWVVLFSYDTGEIAVNNRIDGGWKGWKNISLG